MRITALERQPRGRRINLHIDGSYAFSVGLEVCLRFGLREGAEINPTRLDKIREAQAKSSAMESALRLLAYRPRSESEMRRRLAAKGTGPAVVEVTLGRLRESGLVNDEQFAAFLVDGRDRTSPRGKRLLASELRAKGIGRDIARDAVAVLQDEDAAYRAGSRRAMSLLNSSREQFNRRLTEFLLRRGFEPELSLATAAKLWRETFEGSQTATQQ